MSRGIILIACGNTFHKRFSNDYSVGIPSATIETLRCKSLRPQHAYHRRDYARWLIRAESNGAGARIIISGVDASHRNHEVRLTARFSQAED